MASIFFVTIVTSRSYGAGKDGWALDCTVRSGMDRLAITEERGGSEVDPNEALKNRVDNVLKMMHSSKQRKECRAHLEELAGLLPGPPTAQKLVQLDEQSEEAYQFTQIHFNRIFESMLAIMPDDEVILQWIEAGPAEETLHVLLQSIRALDPCKRRDRLVQLVRHFISSDAFLFSCLRPCFGLVERWRWEEEWLQVIVTLPDVLGNILKQYFPAYLAPGSYSRSVAIQLGRCLYVLSEAMKHDVDVKSEPLALIVAQFCAKHSPQHLLKPLLELAGALTRDNYIARRIVTAMVRSLDDRCLEQYATQAAKWARSPKLFGRIVGTLSFPLDERCNRLLCSKLLFLRGLTGRRVGRNVLTLLSQNQETLLKVATDLLTVWSEKNALLLTSAEQHEFITQCLIMALDLLQPDVLRDKRVELHRILREGVNHHLESPELSVRVVGMHVAEVCTKRIHPDGPELKFDYEPSLVRQFQNLLSPEELEEEKELQDFEFLLTKWGRQEDGQISRPALSRSQQERSATIHPDTKPEATENLDSDDDLEPYDMSEDTVESKYEAPHYIRDLMEMLGNVQSEAEEYEKLRLSLDAAEKIIREQLPREHPSLTSPLLSILIHLQDKFSLPDFFSLRRRALIAVGISQPSEAAQFLTREFYQVNYSVVQRLDMLHVITAVANELSSQPPLKGDSISSTSARPATELVQERIESRTRRFFPSSSTRQEPVKFVNRFSPLAGMFFFPLAEKLDRCLAHLSLMDQDFVLLSNLLRTLASILHSAGPVPVVRRMARTLVDAVWVLRLHSQSSVREASLTAYIQTLLSLDGHQLATEYALEIADWKDWLIFSMERDPAAPVRELAQHAVALLAHLLQ